jgi:methylated-DNA-[protein]-cysteine S-methyltransferase
VWIAIAAEDFTAQHFRFWDFLLDIYMETYGATTYAVVMRGCTIAATAFSSDKKTAQSSTLSKLPLGEAFEIHLEPTLEGKAALQALKSIYEGKEPQTVLQLATQHLPAYTQKVLQATRAVPVGYVTTYGAIVEAIGGGARAVGNAMACNMFPIAVPCHRVVKADFSLGGYGAGGLTVKLQFLRREKRGYTEPKTVSIQGGALQVYPVEQVLSTYP